MICKNCEKRYPPGLAYCPQCGRTLESGAKSPPAVHYEIIRAEEAYGAQYPALRFISTVVVIAGCLVVGLAFVLPMLFFYGWDLVGPRMIGDLVTPATLKSLAPFGYWILFLVWGSTLINGLVIVAIGEIIKMFLAMHDDLSRQSDIVYYMSFDATKE